MTVNNMTSSRLNIGVNQETKATSFEEVSGEGDDFTGTNKLRATKLNVEFLQNEHALMLKGLHEEIDRLQELCRDLQFRCEAGGCLLPEGDFFKCSPKVLEVKVGNLLQENAELKNKLAESHQAIEILDQKEKLALWQHHQELEQRDSAIIQLEQELESKSSALTQLVAEQESKRRKGGILRRLSFLTSSSSNHPSTSTSDQPIHKVRERRVDHLSREDLPSEIQHSLLLGSQEAQSHSSYSSLNSDRSISDDEGFAQRCYAEGDSLPDSKVTCVKLPPISNLPLVSNRQLVRHQLRLHCAPNKVPNDPLQRPEVTVKRVSKA